MLIDTILFQFLDAKRELERYESQMEMIRESLIPKSPAMNSQPGAHDHHDKMADAMVKMQETQKHIDEARARALDRLSFLEDIINHVDDSLLRQILHKRYILGKRWETIAKEMMYTDRHIYRLRQEAIAQAEKYVDDMK